MWKWLVCFALILIPSKPGVQYHRVLFVGNSLTITHPNAALGWDKHNGMAASRPDRDYAHQVQLMLSARQGFVPEIAIVSADIHRFIKGTVTGRTLFDDIPANEWAPDLVIVQMGDNAPPGTPYEVWAAAYAQIAGWAPTARKVAIGKWGGRLGGPDEENLKRAALEAGMEYIYIRDLHTAENVAREYANTAVAWHPNDVGMRRIAERVMDALAGPDWWLPLVWGAAPGGTLPGTVPPSIGQTR